ncbi:retrovirus-related pol polyprotein from transposon TNT 1-94 [Tanacetum coccineum]
MASMKYCDKHNQVGFLKKPEESTGFAEIVDFLKGSHIRYALTHNLTIHDSLVKQFWQTATATTLADGTLELRATIDTLEYTITEASVRSKLHLADASGISMLPNNEIFEGMGNMGYPTDGSFTFWKSHFTPQWRFLVHHILHCMSPKSGGWDQFGSNIATALICLSTGRIYNFSKLIFDGMVANLKSKTKFLMYPRFLQMILEIQTESKHPYLAIVLTKKIFGNMKRGFRGVPRPLLPAMLPVVAVDQSAGPADQAVDQPSPSEPLPSSSHPPVISATTESEPTPVAEPTPHPKSPSPKPDNESTEHTFEQPSPEHQPLSPRQETDIPQSQDPTHPHVAEETTMTMDDLLHLVPKLITKVDSLETELKQTKLTMGHAIVKLVKKVKKMEAVLKRRHVVLPDSEDEDAENSSKQGRNLQEEEDEEPEDQGRIIQDIDDDPLGSKGDFVTPTKPSGEAQEEEISPTTLEAAKTLSKVASQRSKSVDKGKRYKRRKESKGKDIDSGFEDISTGFEEVNTGFEKVNTGGLGVSTGSGPVSSARGQREGKAPMIIEETQAPKRTKEQIQQEEASLAEAIRLQTLEEEETAKQVHLDALLAKRLAEEETLSEQQKKRKAQVQFEAQFYTEEDWDTIKAKLEANAELTKEVLGKDLPEQDFAKRMVDLVNQRKKQFAEERAKAKRNKPMTQSQLRIYMSNYLKNQGTWKLSQLKKLKFEEIKEEFEKLVKQIDTFVPMNIEATKAQLKRYGEELQTEISKKQRIDDKDVSVEEKVTEVKEEEPVIRTGKRKKQKARKGINVDKSPQGDSETDEEESVEAMNPTPLDTKSNIVANWKIFQQGERSIYQIIRANGADTVYMSFGAMLKDFTREDLIELYRLVMQKYGTNRPEDVYDRVLWSDLRTMFDPPLNEDAIWSLPLQQKIISWRYYDKCEVHCLTLEACSIYMLADRKYPLSKDACQVMLKMKLLDGKMNEVCYKLLKMIEKQAGEAHNEDTQRNLKFTSKDQVRGGLLGIIVNKLKSGSYRVKSGRHMVKSCGSYDHFTLGHNRVIHIRGGVLAESSQSRPIFNANKEIVLIAPRRNDVYVLDMLSHLKFKNINKLAKQNKVLGLPSLVYSKDKPCSTCEKGKHRRASFKTKQNFSIRKCLHLLHMDLFRPVSPVSINHEKYTLVIVDEYSRYTWVHFLKNKSQAPEMIMSFIKMVENQNDVKVKQIRIDNGTEFRNHELESFCNEKEISHNFSSPYTPEQNGVAERKNRTVIEASRTMLNGSILSKHFWTEARKNS